FAEQDQLEEAGGFCAGEWRLGVEADRVGVSSELQSGAEPILCPLSVSSSVGDRRSGWIARDRIATVSVASRLIFTEEKLTRPMNLVIFKRFRKNVPFRVC